MNSVLWLLYIATLVYHSLEDEKCNKTNFKPNMQFATQAPFFFGQTEYLMTFIDKI